MNYFLGIDQSSGELEADFEDTASGPEPPGERRHRGQPERVAPRRRDVQRVAVLSVPRRRPRRDLCRDDRRPRVPTPPTAPRSAPPSTPATQANGSFQGQVDEARIWNVARTPAQIQASMNTEVTSGANLIGRWGMNEGSGTTTAGSVGGINGAMSTGTSWVAGVPVLDPPPTPGGNQGVQIDGVDAPLGSGSDRPARWAPRRSRSSCGSSARARVPAVDWDRGATRIRAADHEGTFGDRRRRTSTRTTSSGLDSDTGELEADFEDRRSSGGNHPVNGATIVSQNVWHHGGRHVQRIAVLSLPRRRARRELRRNADTPPFRLNSSNPRDRHRSNSVTSDHVSLPARFAGQVDEVRIWNAARTPGADPGEHEPRAHVRPPA